MECNKYEIFQNFIFEWYRKNGRIFPWRYTFDPYKVLVSEVLLQQTNAEKVVKPYNIIVENYKTVLELANADIIFLRNLFNELGLFYRADRLISISKQIMYFYNGKIPDKKEELLDIKGIGDYISSAVLCFGYNKPYAIVDTNIIRLFERIFNFRSSNKRPHTDREVWKFAQRLIPEINYVDYNYGLLDFASIICRSKKPLCNDCIVQNMCLYSMNDNDII